MIPSLPYELIIKIIEHTYYLRPHHPNVDNKTLSACAAVCKQWSGFARSLLFLQVDFNRRRNLLSDFMISTNAIGLGACIRCLDLSDFRGTSGVDFITMLSYVPNLYKLHLKIGPRTLKETELEMLCALQLKIRALALSSLPALSTFATEQSRVLYQLMAIWPSVQYLHLSVDPSRMAPPPAERPPFSLYELSLDGTAHGSPCLYSEPIIRWLLPPIPTGQRGSLHILALSGEYQASDTLTEYAPYVRSLRMTSQALPPQDFFFFERYNTLEELVVAGIFPTSDLTFDVGFRLPQTIEHLAFADGDVYGLKYCARELRRSGLPRLRQVSIGVCTSEFPDRDWPNHFVNLARICDDRGVPLTLHGWGLSLSTDYWNNLTQSIHREYPVPADRFPRDWTIENLYRMNIAD